MIYFLDIDPKLAASYLADKHLSSQLCCACTIICTVLHNYGIEIPQKTFSNNTLTNWTSISRTNFEWLVEYARSVADCFEIRYGKRHQTSISLDNVPLPDDLPNLGITEFPQMIPDRFKIDGDSVEAIRNYYVHEKAKLSNFKEAPKWFLDKLDDSDRTLFIDFFEEVNSSIRVYRDKKSGLVIQKKLDDSWITASELGLEGKILIERILDVRKE